jgi:hypothetical protein
VTKDADAAFTKAAHRYSVFYRPTGAGRVARVRGAFSATT